MSLFDPPTEKELEWANLERSDKFHRPIIEAAAKAIVNNVPFEKIIQSFMWRQLEAMEGTEGRTDREQLLHVLSNYGAAMLRLTQMHSHGKN